MTGLRCALLLAVVGRQRRDPAQVIEVIGLLAADVSGFMIRELHPPRDAAASPSD